MKDGLIRIAAATPETGVADVKANIARMGELAREAARQGCAAAVFPELAVTGYTCGDLFRDATLLQAAERGLSQLMEETEDLDLLCVVGVPVAFRGGLYNCAAVFLRGRLLGLPAKTHIPNYAEFYEARHFTPAPERAETVLYCGQQAPMGGNLLFSCDNVPGLTVGVEICEDLWVAAPPSTRLAQYGATVLLNPSCSDETIGKAEYRRELVKSHSARLLAAYAYADSGFGESTTDMVFSGHRLIAENGTMLSESGLFTTGLTVAELDLERLVQERRRMSTWVERSDSEELTRVPFSFREETVRAFEPQRVFPKTPFVPGNGGDLEERCSMILAMQSEGLAVRLKHVGCSTVVIGLSGGLDSTLALLVAVRAFDRLKLPHSGIKTYSMPGFGTTSRTKSNAQKMAEELGVSFREISIEKAVRQHFSDIGQKETTLDVTYENSQARERTQVLMDLANQCGGLVVGTGDLSELALGWATYNGDHMSMYAVNASIPKTLVRYLVRYAADHGGEALKRALYDVLDTPVSPELLPPKDGEIAQKTEELVGPYELHDFFLYYLLRFGFTPRKIYRMACRSFAGDYSPEVIRHWLRIFYRRFFTQQFKRSCLPDGPKVGSVTLSPRGDFRMPSDACSAVWLEEIDRL